MRGGILIALVLGAAPLLAQENVDLVFGKKPYKVHALEFQVSVPIQWQVHREPTGFVARDRSRLGFQVTREPMLADPDTFEGTWQGQLAKGGVKAEVKKKRAGRYTAWRAAWTADGDRQIEVWRIHAPENEMLYNVAFSAAKDVDLEPLTEGVLRSFRCLAPKARIRFQPTATGVGTRLFITLPVGYVEAPRGIRLGGGDQVAYLKGLPGYTPAHESGRIGMRVFPAGGVRLPDGSIIQGNNLKDVTAYVFKDVSGTLGEVTSRPRQKAARAGKIKGLGLTAAALTKEGLPKSVHVFAGKLKRSVLVITIVVDQRETRLHRDFFKQVCAKVEAEEN